MQRQQLGGEKRRIKAEGLRGNLCFLCMYICVCVYLYGVAGLQREGAVLPEDGHGAGEHGAQHPGQRYHPEAHVLPHPGLQVVHDAPETHRHNTLVREVIRRSPRINNGCRRWWEFHGQAAGKRPGLLMFPLNLWARAGRTPLKLYRLFRLMRLYGSILFIMHTRCFTVPTGARNFRVKEKAAEPPRPLQKTCIPTK